MSDTKWAVFNPHNKPVADLPVIYGFNNGGGPGWYSATLIAEDGTALGGHLCSDECYMPFDLGIIEGYRKDRHEGFQKHYPDGYRMVFVSYHDVESHEGLQRAFAQYHMAWAASADEDTAESEEVARG